MKHLAQRLFAARKALLGTGLAFALAAAVTTAPAAAQRLNTNKGGTQWELGVRKESRSGGAELRVGSRGVSLDLHSRNGSSRRSTRRSPITVHPGYDGGRYEYRSERFWVPGYDKEVWVEPVYEWRYDPCGRRTRVLVRSGYYRTVCVPGRYDTRQVKVWVPARRTRIHDHRRDQGRRYDRSRRSSRTHRVTHRR